MSDRTQIEEIKSKLDIVSVVSQYVPTLKRSGRNHFGLCPFHKEKTPSFSVSSDLGLFKCFGCQEAGDVIKFIEKIEGLEFPQALEVAAKRAGVILKRTSDPRDIEAEKTKKDLLSANSLACEFYHYLLLKHPSGEVCRDYAQRRKLPKEILEKFMIGYAPAGYENLKKFLLKKGFNENDLVNWGLLVNKNGKVYDKFRKRFMFPIISHQGDVVGFSGRLIDPEDKGPKYLNSPETPVYKKSNILFGLYQAKEAIRKEGFAVLVEGNVDILSSHKTGVQNIVAPLGTALTKEQVTLLKRYCDTIYFALDTDSAGQKALVKDLGMVDFAGMNASVLEIGQYQDVDELITKGGNWEETIKNPKDVVIYFIESLQKKFDLSKPLEKNKFIKEILEIITRINNPVLINDYLNKMVGIVRIDLAVLSSELKKIREILKTNNIETLPESTVLNIGSNTVLENENMRMKYFLGLLMNRGSYKNVDLEGRFEEIKELINDKSYQRVFEVIFEKTDKKELNEKEFEIYSDCVLLPVEAFADEQMYVYELDTVIKRLKKEKIMKKIEEIKNDPELDSNPHKLKELQRLTKELV